MCVYRFSDGQFEFYTAYYGSWARDIRIVFRVRIDRDPKQRAKEKGIENYDRIIPSTEAETAHWFRTHPDYPVMV